MTRLFTLLCWLEAAERPARTDTRRRTQDGIERMYGAQANYKNAQDQIAAQNDPFNTILGAAAGVGTSWAFL